MSKQIAVATNATTLSNYLETCKTQLIRALPPRSISPDRLIRCVLTQCQTTPGLMDCTMQSIAACMIQSAQLGLEVGGALGQAYMVPFNNKNAKEAQFQIGYKGLIALAGRSARAVINANVVFEKDYFLINLGSTPKIEHTPCFEDRGRKLGVYAVVRYPDRPLDLEFMSWDEVMAHKMKYSKQKSDYSPWATAEDEMAKKTVIRRLAKRCPISVEMQRAASLDEYADEGVAQNLDLEFDLPETTGESQAMNASRTQKVADRVGKQAGTLPLPEHDTTELDALKN